MIGVISDTHDNMDAIRRAVELFNKKDVKLVLHAGDFVSPFTSRIFKELNAPLKGVFGNNDGDRVTLVGFFKGIAEFSQGWTKIEYGGKIIYLTHRPLPEAPAGCDIYIFGHTHEPVIKNEKPLVINPGECSGWLSGKCTVALISAELMEAELIEI